MTSSSEEEKNKCEAEVIHLLAIAVEEKLMIFNSKRAID